MPNPFLGENELRFMSEVDAALHRRGHRWTYVLSATIYLMLAAFLVWAHFAILDEVTRGDGQVIPSQRVQVIQNLEGGILEETLVRENQIVNKGDILVRISNEVAQSTLRDAASQARAHQAAIARLEAEANGQEPVFPDEVKTKAPHLVHDQMAIYTARQEQLTQELNILKSQYSQRIQEANEMSLRRNQVSRDLKLAQEQMDIARPLMQKNVYPKVEYLSLERDVVSLRGDLQTLGAAIPRTQQAAQEIKERQAQRLAEYKAMALEEMNKHQFELESILHTLAAGRDRVTRTDVRSSVRGTIKQIVLNTAGGVIKPGEPIMEIVPLDDTLLIEANITPADIAFLHPGQKAMVKITAYDFSIYGGLEGSVEQISADTIENQRGDSFFKVKLRTTSNALTYKGEKLPIIPGMTASVDILTGKKSVLDYLLKPILKAKQNALRER
ncbi:MAG: HlyD family type I secretion periplasmic adaptor subunit [Deltaproteobacteria bacterium]|nr:HlyD family type I secretion periplasmic adaptor subunit [Deltaproteobacteria bacterium]